MIVIHLTDEQASTYRDLNEWANLLTILKDAGALGVKNGQVVLNFDKEGQVGSVEVKQYYRPTYAQRLSTVADEQSMV